MIKSYNMVFLANLLLALSLAADAFAVAVGTGISQKKIQLKQALLMAGTFGFFQALMPVIGFVLASFFAKYITAYDHWIAFILLGYIGGNMIYAGWKGEEEDLPTKNVFTLKSLITLGIATSIDALAVGVSLTASTQDIWTPAITIGIVTFICSFIGVEFGKRFSAHIGSRAEIIGGCVLVSIGIKILCDHLVG
ncbi:MAG: manganese efflux pump MntP family protein [Patescibacteria group bacterium]